MDFKYFRLTFWINGCPRLQGAIGIWYDSYREIKGPETLDISFYFFGLTIEIGPRLSIGDYNG